MKKSWMKPVVSAVVVVAVCAGGYYGYKRYTTPKNTSTQNYVRVKAKVGNMVVNVTASGTISAAQSEDIVTSSNGTIDSLGFKEGDKVTKGSLIAKVKDTTAEDDYLRAQNSLAQDNVSLQKLQQSLANLTIKAPISGTVRVVNIAPGDDAGSVGKAMQNLIVITASNGVEISVSGISGTVENVLVTPGTTVNKGDTLFTINGDDVKNSINAQNLTIQQAQQDLSNKKDTLDKESLTASFDGVLAALNYKVGDTIQSGKVVATVIDPDQIQTVATVDELDIDKVKVGQKATVTLDALSGKTFVGQVDKIATLGKTTNGVTTYDVTVLISNPEGIKVGMTTNVNIQVASKDNVVELPLEAVQSRGNMKFVILPSALDSTQNSSGNGTRATQGNNSGNTNGGSQNNGSNNGSSNSGNQSNRTSNGSSSQGNRTSSGSSSQGNRNVASRNMKQVQVGLMNENYAEIISGVKDGDEILIPIATNSSTSTSTQQRTGAAGGFGGFGGGFGGGGGRGN